MKFQMGRLLFVRHAELDSASFRGFTRFRNKYSMTVKRSRHSGTPTLRHSEPFMGEESITSTFSTLSKIKAATMDSSPTRGSE